MRDGGSVIDKLYQLSGADMLVAAQQQCVHSGIECSSNHGIILKLTIKRVSVLSHLGIPRGANGCDKSCFWRVSRWQRHVRAVVVQKFEPKTCTLHSHPIVYPHTIPLCLLLTLIRSPALSLSSPFTRPNQKHKENTLAAPPSVFLTPTGSADGLQLSCSVQTQRIKGAKSSQIAR